MEILAKSKGGRVTDRLKEAGGNAVSRRTETSYKAERLGKAAQHVEAQDSGRTVNGAVVQLQFTFLSGETCPAGRSSKCIDTPADSAGSASYSAKESADGGNTAGDGTGVSREHSTEVVSHDDRFRKRQLGKARTGWAARPPHVLDFDAEAVRPSRCSATSGRTRTA